MDLKILTTYTGEMLGGKRSWKMFLLIWMLVVRDMGVFGIPTQQTPDRRDTRLANYMGFSEVHFKMPKGFEKDNMKVKDKKGNHTYTIYPTSKDQISTGYPDLHGKKHRRPRL